MLLYLLLFCMFSLIDISKSQWAYVYINGSGSTWPVSESKGYMKVCVLLRYGQIGKDHASFQIKAVSNWSNIAEFVDLNPLSRRYVVTAGSPLVCIKLAIHSDDIVTKSVRRVSFHLIPINISAGLTVDRRNLTYIIYDSDNITIDFSTKIVLAKEGGNYFKICLVKQSGTIAEGVDITVNYEIEGQSSLFFKPTGREEFFFNRAINYSCIQFVTLADDDVAAKDKVINFKLRNTKAVKFIHNSIDIHYQDDDGVYLQLEGAGYTKRVKESDGYFEVCATLRSTKISRLNISIPYSISAAVPANSLQPNVNLDPLELPMTIKSETPRRCTNLIIVQDHMMTADIRTLTFSIEAQPRENLYLLDTQPLIVEIQDSDTIQIIILQQFFNIREGNPPFSVCLRRIKGSIGPGTIVFIGYKFNNVASGRRIIPSEKYFNFTEAISTACVQFKIMDDDIAENTTRFNMTLVQGEFPVVFLNDTVSIKLTDNDAGVEFEGSPRVQVLEDVGNISVCIKLTTDFNKEEVVVKMFTMEDTAKSLRDFQPLNAVVLLNHRIMKSCRVIIITRNSLVTNSLTFSVNLELIHGPAVFTRKKLEVEIINVDKITVDPLAISVILDEGNHNFTVCVNVSKGAPEAGEIISFGQGFVESDALRHIKMFEDEYFITHTTKTSCTSLGVLDNDIIEPTYYFTLKFNKSHSVEFTRDSVTVVVRDNDYALLGIHNKSRYSFVEGGTGVMTERKICFGAMNLRSGLEREIIVQIEVKSIQATSKDFTANSTVFTIPKYSTLESLKSQEFCTKFIIFGDIRKEEEESFQITFTCLTPDVFESGSNVVTASIQNDDLLTCPQLNPPKNGVIIETERKTYLEAVYECNHRFWVVPYTLRRRVCLLNKWNGSAPQCVPVKCTQYELNDGFAVYQNGSSKIGNVVSHLCLPGYVLIGYKTRVCQENGLWSMRMPICQARHCGNLTEPAHGTVTNAWSKLKPLNTSIFAIYTCEKGYMLRGSSYRVCRHGQWTGEDPTCDRATSYRSSREALILTSIFIAVWMSIHSIF